MLSTSIKMNLSSSWIHRCFYPWEPVSTIHLYSESLMFVLVLNFSHPIILRYRFIILYIFIIPNMSCFHIDCVYKWESNEMIQLWLTPKTRCLGDTLQIWLRLTMEPGTMMIEAFGIVCLFRRIICIVARNEEMASHLLWKKKKFW